MQMHIFGELKWRQLGGMHHKSYGAASGFVITIVRWWSVGMWGSERYFSAIPALAVGNLLPSLLLYGEGVDLYVGDNWHRNGEGDVLP